MGLQATRELSEAVFPALARKVLILELLRIPFILKSVAGKTGTSQQLFSNRFRQLWQPNVGNT